MSSHHIVKEEQEPALLVQDFGALSRDILDQLLEWSPTVIVDDYNLDFLLSEEIKVDIVFSSRELNSLQEQTRIFPLVGGSFLETALSYLVANGYHAVNIICSRVESVISRFAFTINIVALCDDKRYVFVHDFYEKWKPKGDRMYVDTKCLESYEGLSPIDEGTFETEKDGFFRMIFNTKDSVCIGEDI